MSSSEPPKQKFKLSGVAQNGWWNSDRSITFPLDKNLVMIGDQGNAPRNNTAKIYRKRGGYLQQLEEDLPESFPFAYHVHERCWWLAKKVIGEETLEKNLGVFVACLCGRWSKINRIRLWTESQWGLQATLPRDPVNVIELRDFIDEAIERREMGNARWEQEHLQGLGMENIPIDLQCLVVDAIEEDGDIENLLVAFRWTLPDGYWRARFPKDVIFEYYDLVGQDLDWQFLSLALEGVFQRSHGLRNRRQILQLLKGHRDVFNGML